MGVGLIIAAVTIGATVATTLFAKGPRSTKGADMAPANLDAFRLTTAEEGTVIPRVFGTVRLPGNLLYYGNLSSEPEYEETTVGGKGGKKKKQKVLQGYHYRMDVWQGIGMGPLELVGVYQDDRLLTEQGGAISCAEQVWNNGTGAFYPAQAGPYASRLPGVSHIWLRQFYLGFNVSMMPTLHYVVRFCGDIPLEHAILSNGVNPAAIILQLLLDAGASWSSIDKPSFSAAASFWAQKGYGLNIVFSRQKPVRDHIMQVLGAVGGWLIERADGTLSLRAPDPDVAPSATLGEGDFLEGSFFLQAGGVGYDVERSFRQVHRRGAGLFRACRDRQQRGFHPAPRAAAQKERGSDRLHRPQRGAAARRGTAGCGILPGGFVLV